MSANRRTACETEPRLLTTDEIERRIDALVQELARSAADVERGATPSGPRWISAAEIVRRMRPFLVWN